MNIFIDKKSEFAINNMLKYRKENIININAIWKIESESNLIDKIVNRKESN